MAIEQSITNGNRYPRETLHELKEAIAAQHGVTTDHILLGSGSAQLLQLVGLKMALDSKAIVSADYTFRWMMRYAENLGSRWIKTPLDANYKFDLDAIQDAVNKHDKQVGLVYICNPNNPTGTYIPQSDVHAFCKQQRSDQVIFLDEAYMDYVPESTPSAPLLKELPNLLISRTFSKLYGLAGLRVGYLLGHPDLIKSLEQLETGFGMNVSNTSAVAAIASLKDTNNILTHLKQNESHRNWLTQQLQRWKLPPTEARANFVLCEVTPMAKALSEELKKQQITLNPHTRDDSRSFLRISIGRREDLETFVDRMDKFFTKI
jgi:histidinol-phosphate aminotransferase